MRALSLAALVLLTACATRPAEPVIRTVEVKVPVAVTCVPKTLGEPPAGLAKAWAAVQAAAGPGDLLQALGAYAKLARQRLAETEPVITGCR